MMRRRIFIRKLLADIFVFVLLYSLLSAAVFLILRETRPVMMTGFLAVPFFLMFWVRGKVNNFFLFLAVHVLLVIWITQIPVSLGFLLPCLIFLMISAVYSLGVRLKGGSWHMEIGSLCLWLGISVSLTVALELNGIHELTGLLSILAFIMIFCWLLYTQMIRVDDGTGLLYGQPHRPVGAIVRLNNVMIAVFLLLTIVAALFSGYIPMNVLIIFLKNTVLSLIRWLAGLFKPQPMEEVLPEEQSQPSPDMSDLFGEQNEPPPEWLKILEQILFYAVQAAIVIGLVAAVVYGIYSLYKKFYASGESDGDTREYVGPAFGKDSLKRLFRGIRDRIPVFGGGEREKIRRAYYKKVRRHMRRGIKIRNEDTTGEIAKKISQTENIEDLTSTYNHARYRPEAGSKPRPS